jgi:hypothetical protein
MAENDHAGWLCRFAHCGTHIATTGEDEEMNQTKNHQTTLRCGAAALSALAALCLTACGGGGGGGDTAVAGSGQFSAAGPVPPRRSRSRKRIP